MNKEFLTTVRDEMVGCKGFNCSKERPCHAQQQQQSLTAGVEGNFAACTALNDSAYFDQLAENCDGAVAVCKRLGIED